MEVAVSLRMSFWKVSSAKVYEKQKRDALAEWSTARKKLQTSADERLATAAKQLEELRGQTASKLGALESSLAEASGARAKVEAELQEAVKRLNAKHAAMLTERMAEEDRLSAEVRETREAAERDVGQA